MKLLIDSYYNHSLCVGEVVSRGSGLHFGDFDGGGGLRSDIATYVSRSSDELRCVLGRVRVSSRKDGIPKRYTG